MKISFDLDDLLIPGMKQFETERQTMLHRLFGLEKIRKGAPDLFRKLRNSGHTVGIYTTSLRSVFHVRKTLLLYGVKIDFVVNQQQHAKILRKYHISASKYPPAFGIDLHIDDSEGVGIEGEKFGFKALVISENQVSWISRITGELL